MDEGDPHDLQRFLDAQAATFDVALGELRRGHKQSHWMWFVFPQLAGLGVSPTAQHYAIKSRDEAIAYLAHPVLGERLVACAKALLGLDGLSAWDIMGSPDDLKLRSSATLFASASPDGSVFHQVLDRYFKGVHDGRTLELLAQRSI